MHICSDGWYLEGFIIKTLGIRVQGVVASPLLAVMSLFVDDILVTTLTRQDSSSTTGSLVRGFLTSAVVVEQQKISRNVPPYIWWGCSTHPIP